MVDKKVSDKNDEEELPSWMKRLLSKSSAVGRIIFGICAFLLWFILGVPPTLIYASGVQTFIGTFTFFSKNPVIFLLVAILNVFLGLLGYFFLKIEWFTIFHLLWSIRWFWGYNKYRSLKKTNE